MSKSIIKKFRERVFYYINKQVSPNDEISHKVIDRIMDQVRQEVFHEVRKKVLNQVKKHYEQEFERQG